MTLPPGFDLRALRIFVAVVETGGMSAAARHLGMTQSSVSQAVSTLEEALEIVLFDRAIRPIALTGPGSVLHRQARMLLADATQTFHRLRDTGEIRRASLTIGMAESVANTVGPILVSRMADAAEHWRIWSGISPDQHEALLDHTVDMIVTTGTDLDDIDGVELHPILIEPFVLVQAIAKTGARPDLAQLATRPFVRYSLRSSIGRQIERQLRRLDLDIPFGVEFDTATGQLAAVAAGMGWSMTTPLCLAQEWAQLPRLTVDPMPRGRFTRSIRLAARRGEMGDLPARVATVCRAILAVEVMPRLDEAMPWVADDLTWPS
ncbi:LysR family transcriptional regulator [Jannaschia donghaensis]|uniref:HTH-type transcriptional regulator GltC n=1 Tax=Jannaschia donghaensis TaxID=420998 RepID=A0A0M6YJF3_9RHOB|nr:LysR family transcriptional regulator [Jannaschia donghaensis]CTQ50492.1 HTH-type transcriptional regulator GltC [Jannaschia donghaensis]